MPNFGFHIRHGNYSSDHNVDLPDERAAHMEAAMIFGDMARDVAAQLNETPASSPRKRCSTSCDNITPISHSGLRMKPHRYQGGWRSWNAFMNANNKKRANPNNVCADALLGVTNSHGTGPVTAFWARKLGSPSQRSHYLLVRRRDRGRSPPDQKCPVRRPEISDEPNLRSRPRTLDGTARGQGGRPSSW